MEALRKSIGNISELPCVLLSFLRVPNRFACFCAFFCKPEKTHHHKSWIMPPNLLTWTQRLNGPHIFLHAKTKTVYYTKYWSWKREITHMEKQMKAYKNFFIKTFFCMHIWYQIYSIYIYMYNMPDARPLHEFTSWCHPCSVPTLPGQPLESTYSPATPRPEVTARSTGKLGIKVSCASGRNLRNFNGKQVGNISKHQTHIAKSYASKLQKNMLKTVS